MHVLGNFQIFHDRLGLGLRDNIVALTVKILNNSIKFIEMMHNAMK